jgi:hypothetical protein
MPGQRAPVDALQAEQSPPPAAVLPGPRPSADSLTFDGTLPMAAGVGPFASPVLGKMPTLISYRIFWVPDEPVHGQPTDLALVRQDLAVAAPLWQDSDNEMSLSARLRSDVLDQNAVFPVSGLPLPGELWDVGLGGAYRHRFDNDWIAGGAVQVGSASDKPFHGWDEMNIGLTTFLRLPQGDRNAWLFTLSYSPTAQLPFPIPAVAYVWWPSDPFRMNIGLPLQMMYRPVDDLTFSFSYMLLTSVHARVAYRCWGPVRVYAGYDWENEAYLPADRPETRDRLFLYDMRLSGGAQAALAGRWVVDLSSGYVFDRFFALGTSSALNAQDRIDVAGGPFLALSCTLRW